MCARSRYRRVAALGEALSLTFRVTLVQTVSILLLFCTMEDAFNPTHTHTHSAWRDSLRRRRPRARTPSEAPPAQHHAVLRVRRQPHSLLDAVQSAVAAANHHIAATLLPITPHITPAIRASAFAEQAPTLPRTSRHTALSDAPGRDALPYALLNDHHVAHHVVKLAAQRHLRADHLPRHDFRARF